MNNNISTSPTIEMKELNHLFIELTQKNCNQRCKNCYIDFPQTKNVKDFISIDKIKQALIDTENENVGIIYLTGAEPMTHPDFNAILRLCLKYSNVCICTNGSFINEKKVRFLKKVEDESERQIMFMLSACHFNEVKSDDIRSRGAFRTLIHSIKHLAKYSFEPIICVSNYYNEEAKKIISEFKNICKLQNYNIDDTRIKIIKFYEPFKNSEINWQKCSTDCETGRILTSKGVYSCPFLANDHRGRVGANFLDYSKKMHLETSFCSTCIQNKSKMFSLE